MPVGGCLQIEYTGASASCLLKGDAAAKTLTSLIGAAGAEVADAAFGIAGVLDLTAVTVDTLDELAAVIDAYADYTAAVTYGDDIPTENILTHTVQAKGVKGYVLFQYPASVLATYALTTFSRYQALRGSGLAPNSDQAQVELLINAVTEDGEALAGRLLKARTYGAGAGLLDPHDFDGSGTDTLILPAYPVNTVTHVYIDDTWVFGAGTEVDSGDYTWYPDEGLLVYPRGTFPKGRKNVRVEYNGGFSTVPDRIQRATVEAVVWNLSRLRGNSIGMRTQSTDAGVSSSFEIEMPLSARRVFENLRDRRM